MAGFPARGFAQSPAEPTLRKQIVIRPDVLESPAPGRGAGQPPVTATRMRVPLPPERTMVARAALAPGENPLPAPAACWALERILGEPMRLREIGELCHLSGLDHDWRHRAVSLNEMRQYLGNTAKRGLRDGDLAVTSRVGRWSARPDAKVLPFAPGRQSAAQWLGISGLPAGSIETSSATDLLVVRGDQVRAGEERVDPAAAAELVDRMFPDQLTQTAALG